MLGDKSSLSDSSSHHEPFGCFAATLTAVCCSSVNCIKCDGNLMSLVVPVSDAGNIEGLTVIYKTIKQIWSSTFYSLQMVLMLKMWSMVVEGWNIIECFAMEMVLIFDWLSFMWGHFFRNNCFGENSPIDMCILLSLCCAYCWAYVIMFAVWFC